MRSHHGDGRRRNPLPPNSTPPRGDVKRRQRASKADEIGDRRPVWPATLQYLEEGLRRGDWSAARWFTHNLRHDLVYWSGRTIQVRDRDLITAVSEALCRAVSADDTAQSLGLAAQLANIAEARKLLDPEARLAWAFGCRRHSCRIVGGAYEVGEAAGEDALQDTALVALEAIRRGDSIERVEPGLFTTRNRVLRNKLVDEQRRMSRLVLLSELAEQEDAQ